ncbi:28943_t:CDS:1, partial [Racocetra persica]
DSEDKENKDIILRINFAIDKYNKGIYDYAFSALNDLTKEYNLKPKIYRLIEYYLAFCYIHGHGVKQDKAYALRITNHLRDNKNYEDALKIYLELTKADEVTLKALRNCYTFKELIHNEDLVFTIALELYSKQKYKESFDFFPNLVQ